MTVITFDTLKFARRHKKAGAEPRLAEAEAEVFEVNRKDLPTKDDLHGEVESLRKEMHNEIKQLEQRMVIKLGTLMMVGVGVVATLVKLL